MKIKVAVSIRLVTSAATSILAEMGPSRRTVDGATRLSRGAAPHRVANGKATIVDDGIHLPNGLGFSPDCRTLYFTDSVARLIYAYDYDQASGKVRNRRVFVKVPDDEGLPDGLTVDADGFVWSAQWYGSCIVRYDPDGKIERRIMTPAKQTSSLAFGGKDLTDIFITSAGKSEPMPAMPPGYDPDSGCIGGALYHTNLGIKGKLEFRTNISLT